VTNILSYGSNRWRGGFYKSVLLSAHCFPDSGSVFYWQSLNCEFRRRRQLAQLGSASGVYKTVVKYLVGVPEVLCTTWAFCARFL
jgi:hypothetical protein